MRRTVLSRPDNGGVQEIRGPGGKPVSATISLQSPSLGRHNGPVTFRQHGDEDHLVFTGRFDPAVNGNGYAGVVRIVRKGGTARLDGNKLVIENADSIVLLTRIDWFKDFDAKRVDELVAGMAGLDGDYAAMLARHRPRQAEIMRSEERRVGNECVSTCRSRWSPYHYKKKYKKNKQTRPHGKTTQSKKQKQ